MYLHNKSLNGILLYKKKITGHKKMIVLRSSSVFVIQKGKFSSSIKTLRILRTLQ